MKEKSDESFQFFFSFQFLKRKTFKEVDRKDKMMKFEAKLNEIEFLVTLNDESAGVCIFFPNLDFGSKFNERVQTHMLSFNPIAAHLYLHSVIS